jgi:hypothetical protein
MRLVTTCAARHFDEYAHRLFDGFELLPKGSELHWYTEGFDLPKKAGITEVKLESLPALEALKAKYKNYKAPNYLFDVVRFSNKVFAAVDALYEYEGMGVWIDADCVIRKPIPEGTLEGHMKGYLSLLMRAGMYSETGLWLMDCTHPMHRDFLDEWVDWYTTGSFRGLANWTDCETLDATIRRFERDKLIETSSLSANERDSHPLASSPLGEWVDHCKGGRKAAGFSPEAR